MLFLVCWFVVVCLVCVDCCCLNPFVVGWCWLLAVFCLSFIPGRCCCLLLFVTVWRCLLYVVLCCLLVAVCFRVRWSLFLDVRCC